MSDELFPGHDALLSEMTRSSAAIVAREAPPYTFAPRAREAPPAAVPIPPPALPPDSLTPQPIPVSANMQTRAVPGGPKVAPSTIEAEGERLGDTLRKRWQSDIILENLIALGKEYAPSQINEFRRHARSGDPRKYYGLLDETRRLIVGHTIGRMISGVKRAPLTFAPPKREDMTELDISIAKEMAQYETDQWEDWADEIRTAAVYANFYGVWGLRIEGDIRAGGDGKYGKGRERITLVSDVPARRFRIDPSTKRWIVQMDVIGAEWADVDYLVKTGELLFFEVESAFPLDQRGWGFPLQIPWGMGTFDLRWWAKKIELRSSPRRTGFYDPAVAGQKERVEEALEEAGFAPWTVLPVGSTIIDGQDLHGEGGHDPNQELFAQCMQLSDLIVWGHSQASTVQVGAGSRTSADAATLIAEARVDEVAMGAMRTFKRQAILPSARRNYGPALVRLAPVPSARLKPPEDPVQLATVGKTLKDSGAGKWVDAHDLVRRCLGVVASDTAETLGEVEPAQPVAAENLLKFPKEAKTKLAAMSRDQREEFFSAADVSSEEEFIDRLVESGSRKASSVLRPLYEELETMAAKDDLHAMQRHVRGLTDVIASATLRAAITAASAEKARISA